MHFSFLDAYNKQREDKKVTISIQGILRLSSIEGKNLKGTVFVSKANELPMITQSIVYTKEYMVSNLLIFFEAACQVTKHILVD